MYTEIEELPSVPIFISIRLTSDVLSVDSSSFFVFSISLHNLTGWQSLTV